MGFLQGKKILITGIVSNRSIAYGIAKCCHREGAELAFSYANERFKDRVAGFAADFGSDFVLQMDVSNDEQINNTFAQIKERWGSLDGLAMRLKSQWTFPLTHSRPLPAPPYL